MSGVPQQRTASVLDYLKSLPLYPLPQHAISRLTFRLTRIRTPWFKNLLIHAFAAHFGVDWSEALYQRPEDYVHFNDFFTRPLRNGARLIEGDARAVICPADGHISQIGAIDADAVFQAKCHKLSVTTLVAGDGQQGVRSAIDQNPDLVIADLSVPKKSGFEVLRELRQAGHDVAFLDLLSEPDPESAVERTARTFCPEVVGISVRNIDDQNIDTAMPLLDFPETCGNRSRVSEITGQSRERLFLDRCQSFRIDIEPDHTEPIVDQSCGDRPAHAASGTCDNRYPRHVSAPDFSRASRSSGE